MKNLFSRHLITLLMALLLISLACNTLTGSSPAGDSPTDPDEQKWISEVEKDYGPGPFDLPDTKAGLSNLSSYTASLTITFDGIRDGNAENWSKMYTMLATNNPLARQWTIEKSSSTSTPESVFMAEMAGLDYERRGEEACIATAVQEGNLLADRFELAELLHYVIGAEPAGSETVNDIAADHYTFDQRALDEEGLSESAGELWVASEGGYLVRYMLTRKAKAEYFGEGIEGTLTLDYELTQPNQALTIVLPEDCPPGLVDAPMLPDAANVENIGGMLSYHTSSNLTDAVAFYQEQLPTFGWQPEGNPVVSSTSTLLSYTRDDGNMRIFISPNDTGAEVRIVVSKPSPSQ